VQPPFLNVGKHHPANPPYDTEPPPPPPKGNIPILLLASSLFFQTLSRITVLVSACFLQFSPLLRPINTSSPFLFQISRSSFSQLIIQGFVLREEVVLEPFPPPPMFLFPFFSSGNRFLVPLIPHLSFLTTDLFRHPFYPSLNLSLATLTFSHPIFPDLLSEN